MVTSKRVFAVFALKMATVNVTAVPSLNSIDFAGYDYLSHAKKRPLGVRKNVNDLTAAGTEELVKAFQVLKDEGLYEKMVQEHFYSDQLPVFAENDVPCADLVVDMSSKLNKTLDEKFICRPCDFHFGCPLRTAPHGGPGFFPWHRYFLLKMEVLLNIASGNETLRVPFWDSVAFRDEVDKKMRNYAEPDWNTALMGSGGNISEAAHPENPLSRGNEADGCPTNCIGKVVDGPFANWVFNTAGLGGAVLCDQLTRPLGHDHAAGCAAFPALDGQQPILPSGRADYEYAMEQEIFATAPYNDFSPTGFARVMEGKWYVEKGKGADTLAQQLRLHDRLHLFISGVMLTMASPADPLFWLHHAFVDRSWEEWYIRHKHRGVKKYLPTPAEAEVSKAVPHGHLSTTPMLPWGNVTPEDVLDTELLGYKYEFPSTAGTAAGNSGGRRLRSMTGGN